MVFLVLFAVIQTKHFSRTSEKIQIIPVSHFTPTPTPVVEGVNPTPTLTPGQSAEIKKKRFDDLNRKYGPCRYVPILMYHHVLPGAQAKEMAAGYLNVPPEIFQKQMDYLLEKGYQVISLKEMTEGIKNNTLLGKPVVLTFDDGYRDLYENVFPVLKEKKIKATVFVITQYVGGEKYLNWGQVKEMSDSGLVLIGDHTLNHRSLPSVSKEEERNQIISAKLIIEEYLQKPVNFFAYPYGSSNQNAKDILKENNFLGAVTTISGRTQCVGLPFDLQRIRIGATSLSNYGL